MLSLGSLARSPGSKQAGVVAGNWRARLPLFKRSQVLKEEGSSATDYLTDLDVTDVRKKALVIYHSAFVAINR
ncbi:hypothetical protein [Microcoleus sp. herbarium14]|uniref:hypothetical protein n=1 Tax=Microcoleus sp. herbarium14 TaxID=3055439 RepID=UPI002FD2AAD5